MSTERPIHYTLFIKNALLMGCAMLITVVICMLAVVAFSYHSVAPGWLQTVEDSFRALPDDTDHLAQWDERTAHWDSYPALFEGAALYFDGVQVAAYNRQPRYAFPERTLDLPATLPPPRLQRRTWLDAEGRWQLYTVGNASLLTEFYRALSWSLLALVLVGVLVVALLSYRIQVALSKPILQLVDLARVVSHEQNFTLRAQKSKNDDIGEMIDAFNDMLQRVETRDVQLKSERDRAEKAQVQAQTLASETRAANQRLEFEVQVRAKVERKLTEFQAYLNAMINSMPSVLIAVDENARITQWNDEASRLSGRPLDLALGYSLDEAFPFMHKYMDRLSLALLERETQHIERVRFKTDEGDHRLDMMIYPLHLKGTIGAVIRIDDVSDKVRMEEMMVQSEKMMSVGGLAAGMAHEINNPLSAIVQSVQTIQRRLKPETPANQRVANELGIDLPLLQHYLKRRDVPKFLDHILTSGNRAASIVTNMLQFSRQSNTTLQLANIVDLLERAVAIAMSDLDLRQHLRKEKLVIERDWGDCADLQLAVANTEIEQVIFNLLKNAYQAILQRQAEDDILGIIRIQCRRSSHYCIIQVTDNGKGMDAHTRKRVFEPFFTTKDVGHGTGLGLSVAYFIVTSHHRGQLSVQSEPNVNTTFTIKLPLTQEGA